MTFKYKALDQNGSTKDGIIEAINIDIAIDGLQKRGLSIVSIKPEDEKGSGLLASISFFENVSTTDTLYS